MRFSNAAQGVVAELVIVMKVALLSDIHGNDDALRAVAEVLHGEGIRRILMLGDLVGYFPFVESCCDILAGFEVTSVMGNHDEVALNCLEAGTLPGEDYQSRYGNALKRSMLEISARTREFLQNLPRHLHLQLGAHSVEMHHGSPQDSINGRVYPDHADWSALESCVADLLILGHTHYPLVKRLFRTLVANPGSVGQPRHRKGPLAAFAIYDVDAHKVDFREVSYDVSRIVADCLENQPEHASILKRFPIP